MVKKFEVGKYYRVHRPVAKERIVKGLAWVAEMDKYDNKIVYCKEVVSNTTAILIDKKDCKYGYCFNINWVEEIKVEEKKFEVGKYYRVHRPKTEEERDIYPRWRPHMDKYDGQIFICNNLYQNHVAYLAKSTGGHLYAHIDWVEEVESPMKETEQPVKIGIVKFEVGNEVKEEPKLEKLVKSDKVKEVNPLVKETLVKKAEKTDDAQDELEGTLSDSYHSWEEEEEEVFWDQEFEREVRVRYGNMLPRSELVTEVAKMQLVEQRKRPGTLAHHFWTKYEFILLRRENDLWEVEFEDGSTDFYSNWVVYPGPAKTAMDRMKKVVGYTLALLVPSAIAVAVSLYAASGGFVF